MDFQTLRETLVKDFNLTALPDHEQDEMLFEIAKTIQKQFLFDVYDSLSEANWKALQSSVAMGEDFYSTTLKHLVPNHAELFDKARLKVTEAFKKDV